MQHETLLIYITVYYTDPWMMCVNLRMMHVCVRRAVPGQYGQLAMVCKYAINYSYI